MCPYRDRGCHRRCHRTEIWLSSNIVINVVAVIPEDLATLTFRSACTSCLMCHDYRACDRICAVSMALNGEAWSDVESVGECDHPYEPYPFEEYDVQHAAYLQRLALLHSEHMYFYERGFLNTEDFMPETVDDVYNKNMYSMSWFYDGCYPFDTWEDNYDHWLYDQVLYCNDRGRQCSVTLKAFYADYIMGNKHIFCMSPFRMTILQCPPRMMRFGMLHACAMAMYRVCHISCMQYCICYDLCLK